MAQEFDKHILKNGMVILGEPMESVASVAYGFMLPAGASRMPEGCCGAANVIGEWIFRGAADMDSRQLSDKLDGLGLMRGRSIGSSHIGIGASLEAGNLSKALELYADIILRPCLKDDQFELSRQLATDEVLSLDDDPRQKVMLKLREQFYPYPLGRSTLGEIAELKSLSAENTRDIIRSNFDPAQTIFSVAGKYDFDDLCRKLEELFEDYKITNGKYISELKESSKGYLHIQNDSAQVHIGLMTAAVKPDDDDYYNARVAVSILSGGMSARLFTEVREKRGLCYAIRARYHGLKEAAGIMCYAGTTPDKAQQTYDCIIGEFNRLNKDITTEELDRAKVGLKSLLILQSESTSSRASAIAGDYYMLGRIRSLDELKEAIEQVTIDSVVAFLESNKFKDFMVITIGPVQIETNE